MEAFDRTGWLWVQPKDPQVRKVAKAVHCTRAEALAVCHMMRIGDPDYARRDMKEFVHRVRVLRDNVKRGDSLILLVLCLAKEVV